MLAIFYLSLLAITGCAVRTVAVFVVGSGGIGAGLVLLAAIFLTGKLVADRLDL